MVLYILATSTQQYTFGDEITYHCAEGFRLINSSNVLVCGAEGVFENSPIICSPVVCSFFPEIQNGEK